MAEQFSISYLLKLSDHLSSPLIKVGQVFDDIDKKYSKMANGTTELGKKMTAFATVPIMGWATYARSEAGKMNVAFREMGQSLEDLPASQFAKLKTDILEMSAQVPQGVEELAEFAKMAGKMNELGDVQGFTKFMSRFTTANQDMAGKGGIESFMDMARVLHITQKEYGHTGDVITMLSQRLNTSASAIVDGSRAMAGLQMTTRITNDELFAMSAWMDTLGGEGNMAMKRITSAMTDAALAKDVLDLAILTKVAGKGMTTSGFQKEFEAHPAQMVQRLLKNMASMKDEGQIYELIKIMEKLGLSGERVRGFFLKAAGSADEFGRILSMLNDKEKINGRMAKDAEERSRDFGNQMKMLMHTFERFAAQFGKDINPVFKWFVDMAKTLLNVFTELPAFIRYVAEGVLGLVAVVGPALLLTGKLKGVLAVLGMTAGATGASIGAIAAPILAAAAAITAVINAIRVWEKYKGTIMGNGDSGLTVLKEFGKFVGNTVTFGAAFNPEDSARRARPAYADGLYSTTSGAGGALSSKGEANIKIELGDGLKVGGVNNTPNMKPEINSPGYLGYRHAY